MYYSVEGKVYLPGGALQRPQLQLLSERQDSEGFASGPPIHTSGRLLFS